MTVERNTVDLFYSSASIDLQLELTVKVIRILDGHQIWKEVTAL